MKNYKVGQILYLMKVEQKRVLPVQVVEEVIRTTVDGREKTYSIKFPDKNKTIVDISRINGNLYDSTEKIKKHMIDNAKIAIENMVENAVQLSSIFEKVVINEKVTTDKEVVIDKNNNIENVQQNKKNDIIKVEIGNGQYAKFKSSQLKKLGE
jgi:hypothetical protein